MARPQPVLRSIPDRFAQTAWFELVSAATRWKSAPATPSSRSGSSVPATDCGQVIANPEVKVCERRRSETACTSRSNRGRAPAGKHVLRETGGAEPKESGEAMPPARKGGTITFVGYNYRCAAVQYARSSSAKGKLGKLTHYQRPVPERIARSAQEPA